MKVRRDDPPSNAAERQPAATEHEAVWLDHINKQKARRELLSHRAVVLKGSFKPGESPKFIEVDVQRSKNSQRRLILDAALQTKDMDNARLLWKIRQRLDRHAMHACALAFAHRLPAGTPMPMPHASVCMSPFW